MKCSNHGPVQLLQLERYESPKCVLELGHSGPHRDDAGARWGPTITACDGRSRRAIVARCRNIEWALSNVREVLCVNMQPSRLRHVRGVLEEAKVEIDWILERLAIPPDEGNRP